MNSIWSLTNLLIPMIQRPIAQRLLPLETEKMDAFQR